MRLGLVILPEEICAKVEGFGDGRTGVRPSRSPKDLAQINPAHRSNPVSAKRDKFDRQGFV